MNRGIKKCFVLLLLMTGFGCEGEKPGEEQRVSIHQVKQLSLAADITTVPLNTEKSIVRWRGTKMRGLRGHEGTLRLQEGKLFFKDDTLVGGYIIADMNTIGISDIPAHEGIAIRNLSRHLKSEFNVQRYPTSKFEITKVIYVKADCLQVWGNMTVRGVTRNINIPVQITSLNGLHMFNTEFTLDRFAWHIGDDDSWLEKRLVDPDFALKIRMVPNIITPISIRQ